MKPRILVLSLGWEQVPMLDILGSMDVDVYGVHYSEDYYQGIEYKEVILAEMLDIKKILAFADKVQPTAVISDQDDYAYFTQAVVASKFDLPGPRVETAHLATNKLLQRRRCAEKGIKIPAFAEVIELRDIERFTDQNGFPVIVKPCDSRGSFGVSKVNSAAEIKDAYFHALENSVSRVVIVEQFIEGFEITVDGFCFNGQPKSLSLAKKGKISADTQVSVDIKYPGEMSEDVYKNAMTNNEVVAKALGYDFGMVHSEYIVTSNGEIYLVEAANRGGGCYTSELIVPAVCGVDILAEFVDNAFGKVNYSQPPAEIDRTEVILKFFTLSPGKISSIDGVEEAKAKEEVIQIRMLVKAGDEIQPITTDANRHGFVIVKAENNVRELADQIIESIKVNYE